MLYRISLILIVATTTKKKTHCVALPHPSRRSSGVSCTVRCEFLLEGNEQVVFGIQLHFYYARFPIFHCSFLTMIMDANTVENVVAIAIGFCKRSARRGRSYSIWHRVLESALRGMG